MLLQMALFHSFLWPNSIPSHICIISTLSNPQRGFLPVAFSGGAIASFSLPKVSFKKERGVESRKYEKVNVIVQLVSHLFLWLDSFSWHSLSRAILHSGLFWNCHHILSFIFVVLFHVFLFKSHGCVLFAMQFLGVRMIEINWDSALWKCLWVKCLFNFFVIFFFLAMAVAWGTAVIMLDS